MSEPWYVYVAGPLSDSPPQYLANVALISLECRRLALLGYAPINPAADLLEGLLGVYPIPLDVYQRRSLDLLRLLKGRRGCLYVTAAVHADGRKSHGVAAEIEEARRIGVTVCYSDLQVAAWRARTTTVDEVTS